MRFDWKKAAIMLVSLFFAAGPIVLREAVAQNAPGGGRAKMTAHPNIVLVHGAWGDGSSWSGVIQRLQKAGYHTVAVQLPMSSLANDVARVRQVLAAQRGPTILVAHSFGGAVITQLGKDAPHVIGLVYESALAPDKGETMKGLVSGGPQPAGAAAFRPDKAGFIWLDQDGFAKFFA